MLYYKVAMITDEKTGARRANFDYDKTHWRIGHFREEWAWMAMDSEDDINPPDREAFIPITEEEFEQAQDDIYNHYDPNPEPYVDPEKVAEEEFRAATLLTQAKILAKIDSVVKA